MKPDSSGRIEVYLGCVQEREMIFPVFIQGKKELAIDRLKDLVDDALPNNTPVLFKASIDVKNWVATASWTPEDVEIKLREE
jgi:hypothetical protein